jgi:hypothetical protein
LTQDNNTDGIEAVDQSGDDSPVIKALRKQVADLTKLVNTAPTRESVEAEVRAGLAREAAIGSALTTLGLPAGLSEFLNGKLGESEVTLESVTSAVTSLGFQVEAAQATEDGGATPPVDNSDLANVTRLSAQVRSAATPDHTDLATKLAGARDQGEIAALMREAGLLVE